MPGFGGIYDLVDAELEGAVKFSTWRKQPTQTTASGFWFDLSMSPGNPVPQYYAASPGVSVAMRQSTDGGIFHGGSVSPAKKFVRELMAMTVTATAVPMPMILLDYLLYYPFIDESSTDEQALTTIVTLPRYTDGAGVQMMAIAVAAQTGGQQFFVTYTNSAGVAGRISKTVTMSTQSVNGTVVTTARTNSGGPFIGLQNGDTGVRSIESVTMLGIDVGLFTLVLVKPLCQMSIRGIDAPVEIDLLKDFSQCPQVQDDAYLNFIVHPGGTLAAAPIHGYAKFVWR